MALTELQAEVLKLLAADRRLRGESYVAGGVALNELLAAPRLSRDIDLFHDTQQPVVKVIRRESRPFTPARRRSILGESQDSPAVSLLDPTRTDTFRARSTFTTDCQAALAATWAADRALLTQRGFTLDVLRETPSFVEALAAQSGERVLLQWVRDSAFRFFPLIEHELFGLVLHPFDLATNKVLAMAGRLEPRDWIDVLTCDDKLQPLGYLAWAACGKDPGYNPSSLLAEVARSRYSQAELDTLDFGSVRPDARALGERWHSIQRSAREVCSTLSPERLGECVLTRGLELFRGTPSELSGALARDEICFHIGRVRGSWPTIRGA